MLSESIEVVDKPSCVYLLPLPRGSARPTPIPTPLQLVHLGQSSFIHLSIDARAQVFYSSAGCQGW